MPMIFFLVQHVRENYDTQHMKKNLYFYFKSDVNRCIFAEASAAPPLPYECVPIESLSSSFSTG